MAGTQGWVTAGHLALEDEQDKPLGRVFARARTQGPMRGVRYVYVENPLSEDGRRQRCTAVAIAPSGAVLAVVVGSSRTAVSASIHDQVKAQYVGPRDG